MAQTFCFGFCFALFREENRTRSHIVINAHSVELGHRQSLRPDVSKNNPSALFDIPLFRVRADFG